MSDQKISIRFFDNREVRALRDEHSAKWWFSVLDIVAVLTDQSDYAKARNYWKYLKAKLKKENSEVVSATTQLKITAADGRKYYSDMFDHNYDTNENQSNKKYQLKKILFAMNHFFRPVFILVSLLLGAFAYGQSYQPTPANLEARRQFQDDKFGMFIHWGPSSILGAGEWVMNNRNIHVPEYTRLKDFFNPQQFNAATWVATAKAAGMKYITFITRHHDGFSMWDTQQSNWKITNTPYGKDILKQLADECHKQGMKLFCYYSLLDWYRSDYQYETGRTGKGTGRKEKSDWESYIRFMKAQLTELLTNYGDIAGIWFDGHWDQLDNDADKKNQSKVNWHYEEIYQLIHRLQPKCLISNNHHLTPIPGEDFQAFEKDLPGHNTTGFGGADVSVLPLETCETMNDSWGFNITDRKYKSSKALIHYMVKAACYNANFLLNVGPMPNGVIQPEFTDTLKIMGAWMRKFGETIYGTRGMGLAPKNWGGIIQKGNKLYMHILNKPETEGYIFVDGLTQKIAKAHLFGSTENVAFKQIPEGTFVYTNKLAFDEVDTIVEITLQ